MKKLIGFVLLVCVFCVGAFALTLYATFHVVLLAVLTAVGVVLAIGGCVWLLTS